MMSLMFCLMIVTSCGDDDDGPGIVVPPEVEEPDPSTAIAAFMSQVDADNSLLYNFTNQSVVNGIDDTSFTSAWDFGGVGTSTDANPSFAFPNEGDFTVTLTVTASDGVTDTTSETITVTAPINLFAVITDLADDDTGELRLAVDSIQTGRVVYDYLVTQGASGEDIRDAFICVAGSSTTSDFAIVQVRLRDDGPHEFREGASDETIASAVFPDGMPDVWITVEVSWTSDGVGTPLYTTIIGGQTVIENARSTTNGGDGDVPGHLDATINGAHNFQWKYNSTSSTSDGIYQVDNIRIYSSDSGSEELVFADDFQGRVPGTSLDPDDDPESPYHANSSEATVGAEE